MKEEVETEFTERMEGLREIYRTEIATQQESHLKEVNKCKAHEQVLNFKINEKKAECEDNITYYSQREAEYETKIDELMTRLQEQTATYMKLQSEFDNYEWWSDGEEEKETDKQTDGQTERHTEHKRHRSRESLSLSVRSRPPTRPPTREEVERPTIFHEEEESEVFERVMEPSPAPQKVKQPSVDPEIPPRRGDRSPNLQEDHAKRNSTSSSKSSKKGQGACTQQ